MMSGQRQIAQSVLKVEGDGLGVSGGERRDAELGGKTMEVWAPFDIKRTKSLPASIQLPVTCRRFQLN